MAKLIVKGVKNLSGDANVSKLISYLTPTYKVAFSSNNSAAGLVTRTEYFPSGITVTAKAWPYSGYTFNNWSGSLTGTKAITSFTMGTTTKNITANFSAAKSTLNQDIVMDDNDTENNSIIYPNPLLGNTLELKLTLKKASEIKVTVFSSTGRLVYQKNLDINEMGEVNQSIDLSSLAKGTYIIQVQTNDGCKTAKLIRL